VRRSLGFLIAGVAVGIVIGIAVAPTIRNSNSREPTTTGPDSNKTSADSARAVGSSPAQDTQIVIGNITSVPFQELYDLLSHRSPDELAKLAEQLKVLPSGKETDAKIDTFFKAWARIDARAALRAAASFKNPEQKSAALEAVIEGADAPMAAELAKTLNELPPDVIDFEQKRGFTGIAAKRLSEVDPVSAAKLIDAAPPGRTSLIMDCRTIAENWAASDPEAAVAWAQEQESAPLQGFVTSGVIGTWWEKQPAAAEAYVTAHLEGPGSQQIATTLASRMLNQDPQHANEWVNQLTNLELRKQCDAVFANQMGFKDPQAAVEWATALPGDVRGAAFDAAVQSWTQFDPAAAAKWIGGLPDNQRNEALAAYSGQVAAQDPVTALNAAATISDASIRNTSVEQILGSWLMSNRTAATTWIQNSALSADEKQHLLTTPPRR
jgi:hypothetical protein